MIEATQQRIRLAWGILLINATLCLLITIALPWGATLFVRNSTRILDFYAQSSQGTMVVDGGIPLTANDAQLRIEDQPARLVTNNSADTGLVELYDPFDKTLLSRIILYGQSDVTVQEARRPRFEGSTLPRRITLNLDQGRINLKVLPRETDNRPTRLYINTQHGHILIQTPGEYSLQSDENSAQLSVFSGLATLSSSSTNATLTIQADQRGILTQNNNPDGPYSSEHDLIKNGDFRAKFLHWIVTDWSVEREDQPLGSTEIRVVDGEAALRFARAGVGNAKAEIRQLIDQDLTDIQMLRLQITFRIDQQSLDVCGSLGSECPLTVRLDYENNLGQSIAWQQGFFARGQPSNQSPPFCNGCGDPLRFSTHWQAGKLGEVVVYESENWLERIDQEETRYHPARLKSITLKAEGHTFEVAVLDIALMVKE